MDRMYDAHTHWLGPEDLETRKNQEVFSLVCAKTSAQYDSLTGCLHSHPALLPWVQVTAGLHPWHCLEEPVVKMLDLFPMVKVIGEIGMDSVWCRIDLHLQRQVFVRQLERAAELNKPVILHTKGQEAEIASILRSYPNRYLVHWYSCDLWFEQYEKMDCWFSIGPDILWNKTTQSLARQIRSDRLLIETDGMNAVEWADRKGGIQATGGAEAQPREILLRSLSCCAVQRQQNPEELAEQVQENLSAFLQSKD